MDDHAAATKTCPRCAEEVRPAAKACKHCGNNLTDRTYWYLAIVVVIIICAGALYAWNDTRLSNERSGRNVCELAGGVDC